jgi:5'(3')-deoxyribonucleotidase
LARIGLDVDGVLADFNAGYIQLFNSLTGKDIPLDYMPETWFYEEALGIPKVTVDKALEIIQDPESGFWLSLDKLAEPDLDRLCYQNEVYFVTTRPGEDAKRQTEEWLSMHFGMSYPTVLISDDKGAIARGLKLDVFIDDRDMNLWAVKGASPATTCYVLDYPYNRSVDSAIATRIGSLSEVICDGHLVQAGC